MIFRPKYKWLALVGVLGVLGGVYVWKANPAGYVSPTPLSDDKVVLAQPLPGATVASPLKVSGKARGPWFFEASFPIILKNQNGVVIAQGIAQAQGEWMTTDFVDFETTLTFTKPPAGQTGTLILQRDNPSGLPENDDSRQITVYF